MLFGGLLAIGFANGTAEDIAAAISIKGLAFAALDTFDISVIVWIGLAVGLLLVARSPQVMASRAELLLGTGAGLAMLLPVPVLSWLAFAGVALSLFVSSSRGSAQRRGAVILLAVTIPMFWTRIIMSVFNDAILAVDAALVARAVGTAREGNLVPFADGSGALWIAPDCSSFTNLSLTILAFVVLINATSGRWSLAKLGLGALACLVVVIINVSRISLIGYYPQHFDLIHGAVGAGVAGWLTALVIMATGYFTVRRDAIDLG